MRLINAVYAIHLADLFGPDATVTDVEYLNGFIHFCLPVDMEQDFSPVSCQISGIVEGKLECLITDTEIESQLKLRDRLRRYARDFFKNLDEKDNEHRTGGPA